MTSVAVTSVKRSLLAFCAFNSFAAGVATLGIFFLTKSAYAFTDLENYALGVLLGVTYILGALYAGKVTRALEARFPRLTPRVQLGILVVVLAVDLATPALIGISPAGRIAVWISISLFSVLTGGLWPIVESYQSGGIRGNALRSMLARFNVTWSGANAIAMWIIAPYVEPHPLQVLLGLAVIHLSSLPFLRWIPTRPARHLDTHEPHPPSYERLLVVHRILLAAAYVVMYALTPYLPSLCQRLFVDAAWQTPLVSIWMIVRVLSFAALERWQGWHGRLATAVVGSALLLFGFGLAVLAPDHAPRSLAVPMFAVGLTAFGIGIATLYNAALYYALAVGSAEVDAGGTHESLIGVGYTLGPLCGIAAAGLEKARWIVATSRDPATLLIVALVFAAGLVVAQQAAARSALHR